MRTPKQTLAKLWKVEKIRQELMIELAGQINSLENDLKYTLYNYKILLKECGYDRNGIKKIETRKPKSK